MHTDIRTVPDLIALLEAEAAGVVQIWCGTTSDRGGVYRGI